MRRSNTVYYHFVDILETIVAITEEYCIFSYDQQHNTHQPRTMFDPQVGTLEFFWDANGNLAQVIGCKQNSCRLHEWDEENRLRFVLGEKYAGYYGYDANGERVYKLTGTSNLGQVNSGSMKAQAIFDDAVLYPNPYMVVTPKGYTKHYYAGTERLATVIGGGGFDDMAQSIDKLNSQHDLDIIDAFYEQYLNYDPFRQERLLSTAIPTEDIAGVQYPELAYNCQPMLLEHIYILPKQDILQSAIAQNSIAYRQENEAYFYHGDHLGSAHWITDGSGMPIQYIHYAPYGELITNQAPYGYDERYKFTGKERDTETGYDYYPARFLWSDAGIWLSVDPLAGKYPGISPYAYCAWNPIMFFDPDGKKVGMTGVYNNEDGTTSVATFYYDEVDGVRGFYYNGQRLDTEFANEATKAIGKIEDGGKYGKMLVNGVVKDERTIYLCQTTKFEKNLSQCAIGKLQWMANDYKSGDEIIPSFITLSHEFAHFISSWYGLANYSVWYMDGTDIITDDEKWVVNVENLIRNENQLKPRQFYTMPSCSGESEIGKIPQWDWVKDVLEIVCKF